MTISSVVLNDPTPKINEIEERIETLQMQMLGLHKRKTDVLISDTEYGKQGGKIADLIDSLKQEIETLKSSYVNSTATSKIAEEITKLLGRIDPLTEFDEEIFVRLVESITITERTKLKFKFKIGIEREIAVNCK